MKSSVKILITGADGQLATELILELKNRSIDYHAFNRKDLDITDFEKVNNVFEHLKPNFVINCAAYNDVDRAEEGWEEAFLINGVAVKNLALACNKIKSILIHYSTNHVFDGEKKEFYTIADIPKPMNRYDESKYLGEKFLENLGERYYLIRTSWVFGRNHKVSFPLKLIEWAKKKQFLEIVDDQISSPTFAKDIARATLDLIDTDQYGLYYITNQGFCSKYEWAKYILDKLDWKGEVIPVKSEKFNTPAKRPKFSTLHNFPLKYILKYELPHWQDATDRFLEEIKEEI